MHVPNNVRFKWKSELNQTTEQFSIRMKIRAQSNYRTIFDSNENQSIGWYVVITTIRHIGVVGNQQAISNQLARSIKPELVWLQCWCSSKFLWMWYDDVVLPLRFHYASTIQLLRFHYASVTLLLCFDYFYVMLLLCFCYVYCMLLLCFCYFVVAVLLWHCYVFTKT